MECLGFRLKQERQRLGLTQTALAKIGGIAPNAQGHYESGKRWPKADYLQSVSAAGVNISYLIGGTVVLSADSSAIPGLSYHLQAPTGEGSDPFVDELIDKLGQNLRTTASTIAALATMAYPADAASLQMADNLKDFQSESERFVMLACSLHSKTPALSR